MTLSRWFALLGVVAGIGCLLVGQRTALTLQAYRLGAHARDAHQREADIAWLKTRVVRLSSPSRLAEAAQERHLALVARRTVEDPSSRHPFLRIASWLGGEE